MLRNLTAKETKRILKIAKAINHYYSFKDIETGNYFLATDLTNDLTEFTDQQLEKIIDNSKNIYQCIATEIEKEKPAETIDKSRAETINETLTAILTGRWDPETRNLVSARAEIYFSDIFQFSFKRKILNNVKEFIIFDINNLRKETNKAKKKKLVNNIIAGVNKLNQFIAGYNNDLIRFKAYIDNETIKLTELVNNSADPVKLTDINNILTANELALVTNSKETKKETKKPAKEKFTDIINFETANNKIIELARIETETNSLIIIADQKLKIAIRSGKDPETIEKLYKNIEKLNSKLTETKADISYLSEIRYNFARNR